MCDLPVPIQSIRPDTLRLDYYDSQGGRRRDQILLSFSDDNNADYRIVIPRNDLFQVVLFLLNQLPNELRQGYPDELLDKCERALHVRQESRTLIDEISRLL